MTTRKPMSMNVSKRVFSREAVKQKKINVQPPIMRGGIRL